MSTKQRAYIFRRFIRQFEKIEAKAFAVHVNKLASMKAIDQGYSPDVRELAWNGLFQRLATTYKANNDSPNHLIYLLHDQGNNEAIRKEAKRARHFLTA